MSFELSVIDQPPVPAEKLKQQVTAIMDAMKGVMVSDLHYGVIPGTGSKPTLLKPGAEVICMMFRLIPTFEETRVDLPNNHVEYRIKCALMTPNGMLAGQGSGSCSTLESKYRYRNEARKCPSCGKEAIIKGKAEYGGGWLCFKKKDGCGAKFDENDSAITEQVAGKIENPDIADVYNTVLKMAQKRAQIDATLRTTAASGIFTQDVEDLPDYMRQTAPKPEPEKPVEEQVAAVEPEENSWLYRIQGNCGKKGVPLHDIPEPILNKMVLHPNLAEVTIRDKANIQAALMNPQGRQATIQATKKGAAPTKTAPGTVVYQEDDLPDSFEPPIPQEAA